MIEVLPRQVNWLTAWFSPRPVSPPPPNQPCLRRPHLAALAADRSLLPPFVPVCPVAQEYLALLGPLDWAHFPERSTKRAWPGSPPHPRAPFVAAYLVKLHEGKTYMSDLRKFLVRHPALVWLVGFELKADPNTPFGFDVEASVPSRKQLGRVLRDLDNAALQFLLDSTVALIASQLPAERRFGDEISLDTKHIVAWVAENNPKAYIKESDRLNKERQPRGDRDCKLGCKKKRNSGPETAHDPASSDGSVASTPRKRRPTNFSKLDVYYWGYAGPLSAQPPPPRVYPALQPTFRHRTGQRPGRRT